MATSTVTTTLTAAGVHHVSGSTIGGFTMRYRASEPALSLELFFRREPD